jgi:hypothetical protein
MFVARPDYRVTGRGNDGGFESDALQLLREPLRALAKFVGKLIVG